MKWVAEQVPRTIRRDFVAESGSAAMLFDFIDRISANCKKDLKHIWSEAKHLKVIGRELYLQGLRAITKASPWRHCWKRISGVLKSKNQSNVSGSPRHCSTMYAEVLLRSAGEVVSITAVRQ